MTIAMSVSRALKRFRALHALSPPRSMPDPAPGKAKKSGGGDAGDSEGQRKEEEQLSLKGKDSAKREETEQVKQMAKEKEDESMPKQGSKSSGKKRGKKNPFGKHPKEQAVFDGDSFGEDDDEKAERLALKDKDDSDVQKLSSPDRHVFYEFEADYEIKSMEFVEWLDSIPEGFGYEDFTMIEHKRSGKFLATVTRTAMIKESLRQELRSHRLKAPMLVCQRPPDRFDRLCRLESLTTGLVDQQNECDSQMRANFEMVMNELPALQEVLARLPKLPQRKPPVDKPQQEGAGSTQQSASSGTLPSHPTTPPTTLGPLGAQVPQQTPTVIPVQFETPNVQLPQTGGIQLRLSEHVGAMTPQPQQQPAPQLLLGGSGGDRPNNFLITPIPSQSVSSGDILRAVLR